MAESVSDRDPALLLDMLVAARDARNFAINLTEITFLASRLHQNAVIRALEVIGEAASKLSSDLTEAHDTIPWREIVDMRHRLIHGYADIDLNRVWTVTQESVPSLIVDLEKLISGERAIDQ